MSIKEKKGVYVQEEVEVGACVETSYKYNTVADNTILTMKN